MRQVIALVILAMISPLIIAGGQLFVYDEAELVRWQAKYEDNLQWNYRNVIQAKLSHYEKTTLESVRLKTPLYPEHNVTPLPISVYSSNNEISIPVHTVKFMDDLTILRAYQLNQNIPDAAETEVWGYISAISQITGKRFLLNIKSPLLQFGVPDNILSDRRVDQVSQNMLKLSIVWMMAHQLGHIYYSYTSKYDSPDIIEMEADRFALEILRRQGITPAGLSFLQSSMMAVNLGKYPGYDLREQTSLHKLSKKRLLTIASYLLDNSSYFAKNANEQRILEYEISSLQKLSDKIEDSAILNKIELHKKRFLDEFGLKIPAAPVLNIN